MRVPDEALADLHRRLDSTRWPLPSPLADWSDGVPDGWLRQVVEHWRHQFEWRRVEERLNSHQPLRTEVDGLGVHLFHLPGRGPSALPLLLLHGWPSTVYEMLDLAERLADPGGLGADPDDAFTVVLPSIPGHGFSDPPLQPGFEDRAAGRVLAEVMTRLGYPRFGIHAYDLGASIAGLLCLDLPERIVGYHTTSPANPAPFLAPEDPPLTPEEQEFLDYQKQWYREEGGYAHLLGTRPHTLAYALTDSPAGLAAWILEKWRAWTLGEEEGELVERVPLELACATVAIYWLTGTIASANRFYLEGHSTRWPGPGDRITVPTGVSLVATQRFERPPRSYVERLHTDLRSFEELGTGGHFVAAEAPDLLAGRIRELFRPLR